MSSEEAVARSDRPSRPATHVLERASAFLDRDFVAVVLLLLVVIAAFSPWWWLGYRLAPLDILNELYEPWAGSDTQVEVHNHFTSDSVRQFLIYRLFAERSFHEDGFVGWDALIHGGTPIYAQTTAAFNDWTMQLHRVLPYWTAWHLGFAGQLLIAGLGMLVFLRSQRLSPLVSLLGAIAFVLNSQFILMSHFRFQLAAFAWVPWMLWAIYRYRDGKRWGWPLVPLFIALAAVGGTLQTDGFLAFVLLGIWIATLIDMRPFRLGPGLRWTGHFALWSLLGVGLAAFALYPNTLNFFDNLASGNVRGAPEYGRHLPYLSFLLIPAQLFPTLLGSPRSIDLTKLLNLDLVTIANFGFLAGIIAFRALFAKALPRGAQLLLLIGLIVPLTPLVAALYHRFQIVYIIGGVWAFAWFWQNSDRGRVDRTLVLLFKLVVVLAALWFLASVASVVFEQQIVGWSQQEIGRRMAEGTGSFRVFEDWMLQRPQVLVSELRIWHPRQLVPVIAAFLCFGAIWLRVRLGLHSATLLFSGALLLELAAFGAGWVTFADPERFPPYRETADISAVRKLVGDGRVYVLQDPDRPALLPPNVLTAFGIATIEQYENIIPPGMWRESGYATDARGLGRIGVTHLIANPDRRPDGEGWRLEYQGERLSLWRNDQALPRYLAIADEPKGWLDQFARDPDGALDTATVSGAVKVASATQNRRRLIVPAGTSLLRVAENWSEGWRWSLEGGSSGPVLRGADMSMILHLSPTKAPTELVLRYEPQRLEIGFWITLLSLACTLVAAAVIHRGSHRTATPARA